MVRVAMWPPLFCVDPMPNSRYVSGRAAEYRVRDWLLENGALFVARTAGSKSPADLVAVYKVGTIAMLHNGTSRGAIFVQVKRSKPTKATAKAIRELAASTGTRWLLVHYDRGIKSVEEFS